MINVTTKYEQIGNERKKVFMIRGDEAYAHTTDTVLSVGTVTTGEIKGFKTTITVDVYRNVGASTVTIYDGEEILSMQSIADGVHQVTLSNVYLSYDVEHQLYAVYHGNKTSLYSKSKTVTKTVDLPNSFETSITFNNPTTQINESSNLSVSVTARQDNNLVANGTEVNFFKDGTLVTTVATSSGIASATITGLSKGLHTITATINESATLYASSSSYDVGVGYDIKITQYPNPYVQGASWNPVRITFKDFFGEPVSTKTVYLGTTYTTTSTSGVAMFNTTPPINGKYVATYSGSSSQEVECESFTPTSIDMTPSTLVIAKNYTLDIPIQVNGTGNGTGATLTVTRGGTDTSLTLDTTNSAKYTYAGNCNGTQNITATIGNKTKTIQLQDVLVYWTPTIKYNFEYDGTASVIESNRGLFLQFGSANTYVEFKGTAYDYDTIEFDIINISSQSTTAYVDGSSESYTPTLKIGDPYGSAIEVKSNDHVKVYRDGATLKYYVNNQLVATDYTIQGKWRITKNNTSRVETFVIDNLKIY